nr:hypothetical protein CFP56_74665 [Quercus suber]
MTGWQREKGKGGLLLGIIIIEGRDGDASLVRRRSTLGNSLSLAQESQEAEQDLSCVLGLISCKRRIIRCYRGSRPPTRTLGAVLQYVLCTLDTDARSWSRMGEMFVFIVKAPSSSVHRSVHPRGEGTGHIMVVATADEITVVRRVLGLCLAGPGRTGQTGYIIAHVATPGPHISNKPARSTNQIHHTVRYKDSTYTQRIVSRALLHLP